MRRRCAIRRVAKWFGLIVSLLTTATWAFTEKWRLESGSYHAGGDRVHIQYSHGGRYAKIYGALLIIGGYSGQYRQYARDGWFVGRACDSTKRLPEYNQYPGDWSLTIPLSNIALASVVMTGALWWSSDPRHPTPGHCRCGYNLTGNTSGIFPECGKACRTPG